MSKIVIIGGGASGLVAGIKASENNEVTIIEKNNICGKKILATGNGRCNYFNEDFTLSHYNSDNIELLNIINKENKEKILNFFDEIGIIPKIKEGYYYPYSNQAVSVRDALLETANKKNVNIIYNSSVEHIEYIDNQFKIKTNNKYIYADKVVLATGSCAAPKTGSDGSGYLLASSFNHKIIKPLPSLVQLIGKDTYFKQWNGIRSEVNVSLYENDLLIKKEQGEIMLTDYGISGICVFQLSSLASRLLDKQKKVFVKIDFVPYETDVLNLLNNRNNKLKNRNIKELLIGMLNDKLISVILDKSNILESSYLNELNDLQINNLINNLKTFTLEIIGTKSFDNAQVCSGGVPLSEINLNTMESLKQKDLYLIGEVLDVDGDCGGYNLAFAWLTGIICGENI